ncbi:MAG: imidazole glycerol phosphate synthase subunit HisH [Rickettsiales bacterium]
MPSVVIIDYGSGNIRSVAKAFEHVGAGVTISSDVSSLKGASHIILPGVGAFADCMGGLSRIPGMLDVLREQVVVRKKMFLGVCVGMQLLFERGYEHGECEGLGWIKGEVVPIADSARGELSNIKIPHMGWNELRIEGDSPILSGVDEGSHVYFTHSYHALVKDRSKLLAVSRHGIDIAGVVGSDNIFGVQFHPEKSQRVGLSILENFMRL